MSDPAVAASLTRPIRQLATLAWLEGTWRAHNVAELPNGRSRDLGINTYVFAPTMRNRWIFGADGKAEDEFYITFDSLARHYVLLRLESNPSYGLWISNDGWQGNRIVFTSNFSYANGRQYRRRVTLIHKDARTFGIYDEELLPNGNWTADDAVDLTRQ
ncbi:MAG: hypothetical protein IAI49_16085 [Candidatus Eremiobacteraeota bacterium]|nr:hypothetical protein [Candidatus Eremiobacteraeota bacterium]